MERVIRSSALSGVSSANSGVSPNSPGAKEINYILRVLGPAMCRNTDLFKDVAINVLRLAVTAQLRRTMIEGGETNMPSSYAQIVRAAAMTKPVKPPAVAKPVHGVVCDLLNVLCTSDSTCRSELNGGRDVIVCRSDSQMLGELGRALGQVGDMIACFSAQGTQQNLSARQHPSYTRQLTGEDVEVEEMTLGTFIVD